MNENSSCYSVQPPNSAAAAEEIRRKYLNHEACVKSIGVLYFLGAFLVILASFGILLDPKTPPGGKFAAIILIGLGVFQFWVGRGLRALKSWTRIPTGILSGIGLIGFPIGTIINAYILYLVFCKKGSTVFSHEYHQVIAATPHIKYKTSIIVWILLAILIVLIALILLAALFLK